MHSQLESTRKETVLDYLIFQEGVKKTDRNSVKLIETPAETRTG
jgi:hypothetical protein